MDHTEDKNKSDLAAVELEKQKAEADLARTNADKAKAELQKVRDEYAEWTEGKNVRQQAAAADALAKEMANESTRRSWIADAVPDLTRVDPDNLEGTDKPLLTAMLASRALNKSATEVAEQLFGDEPVNGHVFLTTDQSLVDRLAIYKSVENEIKLATRLIDSTLKLFPHFEDIRTLRSQSETQDASRGVAGFGPVSATVSAIAAALPGVLSLFSAKRTLATADITQDAYVTMVAVAGALLARKNPPVVIMDETRVLPEDTKIEDAFARLYSQSLGLTAAIKVSAPGDSADNVKASAALSVVQTVMETLTKVDEKTGLSMLTMAASQEALQDANLKHIVVVTAAGSSTTQLINDRPLWWADTFSVLTTSAIAFACVDPKTGYIENAGISTGISQLKGKIGTDIEIDNEDEDADSD